MSSKAILQTQITLKTLFHKIANQGLAKIADLQNLNLLKHEWEVIIYRTIIWIFNVRIILPPKMCQIFYFQQQWHCRQQKTEEKQKCGKKEQNIFLLIFSPIGDKIWLNQNWYFYDRQVDDGRNATRLVKFQLSLIFLDKFQFQ